MLPSRSIKEIKNQYKSTDLEIEYKSFPIKAKDLEKYNALYPKAAKIILKDFERISISKVEYKKRFLEAQIKIDRLAQWQGFIVSIIMIIGAVICGIFNQEVVASALIGVSALGLVKAILPIKNKTKKE